MQRSHSVERQEKTRKAREEREEKTGTYSREGKQLISAGLRRSAILGSQKQIIEGYLSNEKYIESERKCPERSSLKAVT